MDRVSSRLRIGEKIGLSTALVGVLFLGVIWHYHQSLQTVLDDYKHLHDVFEVRKTHAFAIESQLMEMAQAENGFLIHRDEAYAAAVDEHAAALLERAAVLAEVDDESRVTANQIRELAEIYLSRFHAIAEATRVKGLDHDSGLQGAFRDRVHELEHRAGNFKSGRLYLQLLQIRRSEKDLGLRREVLYRDKVRALITDFRHLVDAAELYPEVKSALLAETDVYANAFDVYAETVLRDGDILGGKGPFRESAHRLEDMLEAHYVPDLETNILQLRRREKDYLLRGKQEYADMVGEIAGSIRRQITASPIAEADKAVLTGLLENYERDFLALVAQNDRISELTVAMNEAEDRITPLVKQNLDEANRLMASQTAEITETSNQSARWNLIIVLIALVLGIFLAAAITARIVRPVREMAGLLDRLTHENIVERIATHPNGRDEINDMAESLNTMADHRATFVHWWKTSMDEAIALRDIHSAQSDSARDEATDELRQAAVEKVQRLNSLSGQMRKHSARVLEIAAALRSSSHGARDDKRAETLEHAAYGIDTLLSVTEADS